MSGVVYAEKSVDKLNVRQFCERFCIPNGVSVQLVDGEAISTEKFADNAIYFTKEQFNAGLTSIPLWLTINPRNLPALTPKVHLEGFNFMPYFLKRWKTSCKWKVCSSRVLLLTTISSIYTSTVRPTRGLKIFVISL